MDRTALKLAAVLLLGTSVAGCSTFSLGDSSAKPAAAKVSKGTTSPKSMEADLNMQIKSASDLRAAGDYAAATRILSQLMLAVPDNAGVVGEYGKTLVQQGRSKDALDFLKRAAQLQPGDWTIYNAMGVAYDQNGDYTAARESYQAALAIKPGDATVLNNLALSRMQAHDPAGARQYMAQAQAAGDPNPKIKQNEALLASLAPLPSPATTADKPAQAKSAASVTVKSLGPDVVMQPVPKDPKAGPVKQATAAPRKLEKNLPETKPSSAAPEKVATTAAAKKKPAPAADKVPALRMTADAGSP